MPYFFGNPQISRPPVVGDSRDPDRHVALRRGAGCAGNNGVQSDADGPCENRRGNEKAECEPEVYSRRRWVAKNCPAGGLSSGGNRFEICVYRCGASASGAACQLSAGGFTGTENSLRTAPMCRPDAALRQGSSRLSRLIV